jgi:L-ascorbate metabolism protein UlaG (beta-lactamase superfamily)
MSAAELSLTRVVHACVLIELGGEAVLTDPFFRQHWMVRLKEPIGMAVEQLPRLAAVIGGHGVIDHWNLMSLSGYPYKRETPVYVATETMRAKAQAAGFLDVEVLDWNAERRISSHIHLEVVQAQRDLGLKANNYVVSANGLRIFVGTEANAIEPLQRYRERQPAVDIAVLPIDGSTLFRTKLVMNAAEAIRAARLLGARTLFAIHYGVKPIPLIFKTTSSEEELLRLAQDARDLEVVTIETGRPWSWKERSF